MPVYRTEWRNRLGPSWRPSADNGETVYIPVRRGEVAIENVESNAVRSGGLCTHHDDEVFCVQSGEAVDVVDRPGSSATGTATSGPARSSGSPRQHQEGYNDPDDDDVAGFAFGAPSDRRE